MQFILLNELKGDNGHPAPTPLHSYCYCITSHTFIPWNKVRVWGGGFLQQVKKDSYKYTCSRIRWHKQIHSNASLFKKTVINIWGLIRIRIWGLIRPRLYYTRCECVHWSHSRAVCTSGGLDSMFPCRETFRRFEPIIPGPSGEMDKVRFSLKVSSWLLSCAAFLVENYGVAI